MPDDLPVTTDTSAPSEPAVPASDPAGTQRPAKKSTAAKKAPAKKTAKQAPAKKAGPAKKTAAKKAPAKKSPAKQAPAKKAAGGSQPTEARTAIFDRIHELEERIAADAPLPPRRRPPARPPVPKPVATPADKPSDKPTDKPVGKPEVQRAAKPERTVTFDPSPKPEPEAPAVSPPPVVVADPVAPDPAIEPVVPLALVPEASLEEPVPAAPVDEPERREIAVERTVAVPVQRTPAAGVPKSLVALIVLLLMAAAGMGAAAAVKDRPATWRSEAVVSLTPPTSSADQTTGDKTEQYAGTVESEGFAGLTLALAGLTDESLRELFEARTEGEQIAVEVRTDTADHAALLAEAASRQLVTTVREDQQGIGDAGKRFDAQVEQATSPAVREKPTDRQAWLAGGLAALAALLVAGMVVLLAGTSRPRDAA